MSFPVPGRIAELLRRSTVQIRGGSNGMQGSGSGIALNEGRIVTNSHVVIGDDSVVETWDGKVSKARIVKTDRRRDLALLATDKLDAPAATLSSTAPTAGQHVIAVGNPLGFVGAVSTGMVHRVAPIRGLGAARWVQADVRLAPGNSGGPLADIHGQIVGVNTMIARGLALAVPVDTVQSFLASNSEPRSLGVTVRPVSFRAHDNRHRFGLIVLEIERGGPADNASLLAGDVLIAANGHVLESPDDLYDAIAARDLLTIGFLRGGTAHERSVTVQLSRDPVVNAA